MKLKDIWKHPEAEDHELFELEVKGKITVLLGPNGSGKTTMINSIAETLGGSQKFNKFDKAFGIDPLAGKKYIIFSDGPTTDVMANASDYFSGEVLGAMWQSEGERIITSFGQQLSRIGSLVAKSKELNIPLVIMLDRLDSGLSVDRLKEAAIFLKSIKDDYKYLFLTANSYELASQFKGEANFYWVPTNEYIELPIYEEFIKLYDEAYEQRINSYEEDQI